MAAIFLIFTSQAWNMAFSFYQSLRSIPDELVEAARNFQLGPWMRFWRLEVPFGMPALIWNMMMSMSGGWFFVVASEAISVGNTTVTLPGVGSYIALAIEQKNLAAIGWAIAAMFVVILIFDQLLFRPLTASADWFRLEQEAGLTAEPLLGAHHDAPLARFSGCVARAFAALLRAGVKSRPAAAAATPVHPDPVAWNSRWVDYAWYARWCSSASGRCGKPRPSSSARCSLGEIGHVIVLGLHHAAAGGGADRVGERDLGAHRRLGWAAAARCRASCSRSRSSWPRSRRTCCFPIVVSGVVLFKLTPDIWLSPLMILGTQWYILFNVIVGASAIAPDLRYAGREPRGARLAVVAPDGAAGGIPVLCDRRHHRLGRVLEREHRGGGGHLGEGDADRARARRLHRERHECRGLPAHGSRHGSPESVRRHAEPVVLAAAVRASRAQVPHQLRVTV